MAVVLGTAAPATLQGQSQQTAEVSYTNVAITDTTNNISVSVPGTF